MFTHMLTPSMVHYVGELNRVLKPGGRCVASYFLLNDVAERAIAAGQAMPERDFPASMEGCRVQNPAIPEGAVAHYEETVRECFGRAGFRIEAIHYGSWTGRREGRGRQDVVIALRGAAAA